LDNDEIDRILEKNIPKSMLQRGRTTVDSLLGPVRDVLNRRLFPEKALTDLQLEMMLQLLSSLDTDKDPEAARVGEREARVASPFIGRLSAGFNHGIGRSGQLAAPQPKAPGASLMQQVANNVALDAIRKLGLSNMKSGIVTPLSTGMSISLILSALRREHGIKQVLFPRIDHTSPQRAIALSGLEKVVVPTVIEGDAVHVDIGILEKHISTTEASAVLATTTFFPPRESSIIVSLSKEFIEQVAETYAGRASAAPIVQTLAALLALGLNNYKDLQGQQVENKELLHKKLNEIADKLGQRILSVWNPVACAITMDGLDVKEIGARLYNARVTGPRAIEKGGYGSSTDNYPHSYLVMNAAIGASKNDVETATTKLDKEASK
jgi:glutamate/tyrosine decarboxylase-like PLP-dependent enzyme